MPVNHRCVAVAVSAFFVLATGQSAAQPPPPTAIEESDRSKPHLIGDRLDHSFCRYPPAALHEDVEGCCRMTVEITAKGRAGKITGECTHDVFLAPSRACLAPQSFLPALKNGRPVSGSGDIVVSFELGSQPNLLEQVFDFFRRKPVAVSEPEPEICRRRPDDLISALPRSTG